MPLSNKTIAIMQPTFLPWLGYFNMIKKSDVFVFLDDVQVSKRSWQTRNRLKSSNGEYFVSVPIKKGYSRSLIKDCELAIDDQWKDKICKGLSFSYSKSKNYNENIGFVGDLIKKDFKTLSEYNSNIIKSMCERLNINTKFINSSQLQSTGKRDHYLASICKELGADTYLSAPGSKEYIEEGENVFTSKSLNIIYNDYKHPEYNQLYGDFISHLSIVDAILNVDLKHLREMI
tara:strand:- start:1361 stop:2056 length:696 start_codon:yes stop_codon:yes gene_type:complete